MKGKYVERHYIKLCPKIKQKCLYLIDERF